MFYLLVKYTLRPFMRVFCRPVVTGEDNIPRAGGALLASNHLSMCDSLFLPILTRRRVTFLAKQEYFTGRGLKGRAKAAFVRGTGLIPVDRTGADASAAALDAGAEAVLSGRLLAIYPEGTRSPDGRLYRGKTGLARIAIRTRTPVVPTAMIGTDVVQPIGQVWPRIAKVQIRLGTPLQPPAAIPGDEWQQARDFTDEIMRAIAGLSGQMVAAVDAGEHKAAARQRRED